MKFARTLLAIAALAPLAPVVCAQSSSLYVQPARVAEEPMPMFGPAREPSPLSPAVRTTSFTAIDRAEPRKFAVHDLVMIIIREASQADSESSLETQKDAKWQGRVSAFPRLDLRDLLDLQLNQSDLNEPIELDVGYGQEFEGEGEYKRKDTISDRVTGRIIDVKPNGLLVLEARRETRQDKEEKTIIVTGTCRADDVTIDNTVLSTQLYDLRMDTQHKGALRQSSKKGIFTRVLEGLFNF